MPCRPGNFPWCQERKPNTLRLSRASLALLLAGLGAPPLRALIIFCPRALYSFCNLISACLPSLRRAENTSFSLLSSSHSGYNCCLVAQSCPTLCDPMDCSKPDYPVLHHLPELVQTHVHWVSYTIQPSPLLSPSPPALTLSQHQGVF